MKTTVQANKKRTKGPALREGGMVYLVRKNIKTKRPSNKLDHTKLGPFRITKKISKVNYQLSLPENIRIHNVFHISLLKPAPAEAPEPGPVEISPDDQEPIYKVDHILKHRNIKGETRYLVHWKGYQHEEDTWEPEEGLTTAPLALGNYWRHRTQDQETKRRNQKELRK